MDKCAELKRRIGAYAFAVWEMTLYLDTHPHCQNALQKRRELQEQQRALMAEYEAQYGAWDITSSMVSGENGWTWVDGPWPWEGKGGI